MSELTKISDIAENGPRYELKQIWDHENRRWVDGTEENIARLWPRKEATKKR